MGKGGFEVLVPFPVVALDLTNHTFWTEVGKNNRFCIGIYQRLGGVEAMSKIWQKGTMNPVTIQLTCFEFGDEDMPVMIGFVDDRIQLDDLSGFYVISINEKQKINTGCIF